MKQLRHTAAAFAALALTPRLSIEGEAAQTAETAGAPTAPPSEPKPAKVKKAKPAAKKAKAKPVKKASGKSGANKGVKGPAVLKTYAPDYVKGGPKGDAKTAAGNKTIDNGDKLANKLRGMALEDVYKLAVETLNAAAEEGDEKVTVKSLKDKYGKLNLGMQRMNLGNRMRGAMGLAKSGKKQ